MRHADRNRLDRARQLRTALSPEEQLLLACARSRMDEGTAAVIRELARRDLDWEKLVTLGRRHSVFPLLYRQLTALTPDEIPSAPFQRLKELYQGNAARNLMLMGELDRILDALANAGVAAIPYKGPALAIAGYGDLTLRRFADLDLIVRRESLGRAGEALARLGYGADPAVAPPQQQFLFRTQHELAFKKDDGRLLVELHPDIGPRLFASGLSAEELWGQAGKRAFGTREFLALDPETVLHALCVHGAKHVWERLAWVCDIAEWISTHRELDWVRLVAQVERTGQDRMLFAGLQLASELFDASLPTLVLEAIDRDPAVSRLAAQAREVIFREPRRPPGMITTMRFNLLARRGWSIKWRYLLHILMPTAADVRMFRAPRALQFAYYLVRPIRMLLKREHLH